MTPMDGPVTQSWRRSCHDIAASAMIVPGLEARLGFAYEDVEDTMIRYHKSTHF